MVAFGITNVVSEGSASRNSTSRNTGPKNFFRGSPAQDKSLPLKVHLALQLVKHPEFSEQQVRIILNAISLSTPELFADCKGAFPSRTREDKSTEALSRRQTLCAIPHTKATEPFGNVVTGKTEVDILKGYYAISSLPFYERKASFRNASSSQKSLLWRTHLSLFLVKRPDLNDRQKHIILAAMSLATPEHFELRPSTSLWKTKVREPLSSLENQISSAFSLEDGAKIFATLSDNLECGSQSATNTDESPSMEFQQSACTCSTTSDYCPIWAYCRPGNCGTTQSGCGTLWSYPCNGVCR